ncbi:hypothetical protein EON63_23320 [archaeon]|nr:MAG: hypothetical protein EON63_23320 [archaeon]
MPPILYQPIPRPRTHIHIHHHESSHPLSSIPPVAPSTSPRFKKNPVYAPASPLFLRASSSPYPSP